MIKILSTKKLTQSQRDHLIHGGFAFVEYDAIAINSIEFDSETSIKNVIIASKNAAHEVIKNKIQIARCFCVGIKTTTLLIKHGYEVAETFHSAIELAQKICSDYQDESFTFFCSNIRRNELPDTLKENNIVLKEIPVYETTLTPKATSNDFDGVLFFSPSAIESHVKENNIDTSVAFCIGKTTAATAKKYTNNIIIANQPTIENTIVQVIKHFATQNINYD